MVHYLHKYITVVKQLLFVENRIFLPARLCPTFSADGEAKYQEWYQKFCKQLQDKGEPVQHLKLVYKLIIAVPKNCELKRKTTTV